MAVTRPTSDGADDAAALRELLSETQAVLFDFDGPVCDLFGGVPTSHIAREIKDMAREEWGALDQEVEDCDDSHGVLRHLRDMVDRREADSLDRAPLEKADGILTRHEYAAVRSARLTPHLDTLLDALRDLGKRLVVVSNNAEGPVRDYLGRQGIEARFEAVCGRDPYEPRLMKPDPYLVMLALEGLGGVDPARALMIGDQVTDLKAARAAGVRFLGYTGDANRAQEMREMRLRDADPVVRSHAPVIAACALLSVSCPRP
ncbi:HAD family hydrolase [Streptomyces phyllanthi]|uniref:HAD family hydrolase n=1 Tax=Streptomyces phyllanthi TaxID=1803180 RepID=A0A5N8VYX2_9ACTN|nr:HAD family hydrolase [Streptomyces phyllanthi]MPY40437.1 HAD family hydrolase [Streptomyces phyllanthi]